MVFFALRWLKLKAPPPETIVLSLWCIVSNLPSLHAWVWELVYVTRSPYFIDFTLRFAVPAIPLAISSLSLLKMKRHGILLTSSALSLKTIIDILTFTQFDYMIYYPTGFCFVAVTIINLFLISYLPVKLYPDRRFSLFAPTSLCLFFAVFGLSQGAKLGYDSLTSMGIFHLLALIIVIFSLLIPKRIIPPVGSIVGGLIIIFALITTPHMRLRADGVIPIQVLDFFFLAPYLIAFGLPVKIKREIKRELEWIRRASEIR